MSCNTVSVFLHEGLWWTYRAIYGAFCATTCIHLWWNDEMPQCPLYANVLALCTLNIEESPFFHLQKTGDLCCALYNFVAKRPKALLTLWTKTFYRQNKFCPHNRYLMPTFYTFVAGSTQCATLWSSHVIEYSFCPHGTFAILGKVWCARKLCGVSCSVPKGEGCFSVGIRQSLGKFKQPLITWTFCDRLTHTFSNIACGHHSFVFFFIFEQNTDVEKLKQPLLS